MLTMESVAVFINLVEKGRGIVIMMVSAKSVWFVERTIASSLETYSMKKMTAV